MSRTTSKRRTKSKADLDPFSQKQLADIGERWNTLRREHRVQERQLWLGKMLTRFTHHELGILDELGMLSLADKDLLAVAERFRPAETSEIPEGAVEWVRDTDQETT